MKKLVWYNDNCDFIFKYSELIKVCLYSVFRYLNNIQNPFYENIIKIIHGLIRIAIHQDLVVYKRVMDIITCSLKGNIT